MSVPFPELDHGVISFKDRVAIITGAGNGLGRAYAILLASRGARVLVNDLGSSADDRSKRAANVVVAHIKAAGGDALPNYDSNTNGANIVQQAVDAWGRVDIVINNAGILRDKSFSAITDAEWDAIVAVHLTGSYAVTRAAWPYMRQQKYGRIINVSSAAGIYGNFGQSNYSAAKLGLYGFSRTLAIEGAKYNILVNTIAPIAASQMTATVFPPDLLAKLQPEYVAPVVAYLVSAANHDVTGQLIETGAGFNAALRRQRTAGVVFRADETFTPAAVGARIDKIQDFDGAGLTYPTSLTDANHVALLERAKTAPANEQGSTGMVRFDGKTVLVTGAGAGLGRAYALLFGQAGANVMVNDFVAERAAAVVEAIQAAGGKAAPAVGSVVQDAQEIVDAALQAFGGLHAVVNNAGILRDRSFAAMTDDEWGAVMAVHLRGTYAVCKAAWPIFQQQKYGRIVNTSSVVGLHGNFGQANYSTAKSAVLGLTQTLAIEGAKYNILANTVVPNAGTALTATVWPQEMVDAFKPAYIAPVVVYLASEDNADVTKGLFEASGGWIAALRWERSGGVAFSLSPSRHASRDAAGSAGAPPPTLTPEVVATRIQHIFDFDPQRATWPASAPDALGDIIANLDEPDDEEDIH